MKSSRRQPCPVFETDHAAWDLSAFVSECDELCCSQSRQSTSGTAIPGCPLRLWKLDSPPSDTHVIHVHVSPHSRASEGCHALHNSAWPPSLRDEPVETCHVARIYYFWEGRNAYHGVWSEPTRASTPFPLSQSAIKRRVERVSGSRAPSSR
jgi:hypothetical protein